MPPELNVTVGPSRGSPLGRCRRRDFVDCDPRRFSDLAKRDPIVIAQIFPEDLQMPFGAPPGLDDVPRLLSLASAGKRAAATLTVKAKAAASRQQMLEKRGGHTSGLSFLEETTVRPATAADYKKRASEFIEWCLDDRFGWQTDRELDHILTIYLDKKFFQVDCADDASKFLAGLKQYMPILGRDGPAQLPRAGRVIHAWRKIAPGKQRLPLPLVALAAMIDRRRHPPTNARSRDSVVAPISHLPPPQSRRHVKGLANCSSSPWSRGQVLPMGHRGRTPRGQDPRQNG